MTPNAVFLKQTFLLKRAYTTRLECAENTIFDAKRLIGRKYNDPIVQADIKLWPFKVIRETQDRPVIEAEYKGEKKK